MSVPYLSITDIDNNTYIFPDDFWIRSEDAGTNKSISNLTYAPGAKNKADGLLQNKILTITGALRADTLAALETATRSFCKAILKAGKITVSDDTVSRYIDVTAPDISIVWGYRYEKTISVTYLCENPLWLDTTETESSTVVSEGSAVVIDGSGSDYIMYPTIEIENNQGADNPGIIITNRSDGNMRFIYNDSNFLTGDLLVVNSEEGTVKKNGNDSSENLVSPARFLRLQPSSNNLLYSGADCTLTIKYRKAYLII